MSSWTNVNSCPSVIVTFSSPVSSTPVLISGPFVSRAIAIGIPNFSLHLLIVAIFSAFSSYPPCEKLILHTFSPAFINFVSISSLSLAGPIVPIILVFLKSFILIFPFYIIFYCYLFIMPFLGTPIIIPYFFVFST